MEWVSGWIQGIIIAVIISTIIEMILPEGTSKKYIKVVIGVYILFSIVSPVITKITGNNFRVSDIFDLDEYIEASKSSGTLQNKLESQNENQIKEVYLSSIRNDIKEKVQSKGYVVNSVEVEVENDEQYTMKKIKLQIIKSNEEKEESSNNKNDSLNNDNQEQSQNTQNSTSSENIVEKVNEIKINVGNTNANINKNSSNNSGNQKINISSQEKKELKEYLSNVYEINIKNIFINE